MPTEKTQFNPFDGGNDLEIILVRNDNPPSSMNGPSAKTSNFPATPPRTLTTEIY